MKTLTILGTLAIVLGIARYVSAAEPSASLVNDISVSPYYTVGFRNFNGAAESGAGLDVGLGLSKTISAVSFIETSDTKDSAVLDRFGAGVQMQGKLGKWLRPYGRFSVGYALDESSGVGRNELFLRPEFGADLDIYHHREYSVSLRAAWAVDIGIDKHEDSDRHLAQRLKAGLNIKF